jgi:ABC-type lipoprotein release transport system permease subunit
MLGSLGYWGVLFVLSVRNLFSHKLKSSIVGFLMFFGTALVVIGTALLDSVEDSMSKSITSSLAGHLQIYSAQAKDELAIFGGMMMGKEDIGRIPDFEQLKKAIQGVKNVKAVVPMGIDIATTIGGNEIDRVTESLRQAVAKKDENRVDLLALQLRQMGAQLRKELTLRLKITATPEEVQKDLASLDRLESAEFWTELKKNPEPSIQFLETKIASLATDGIMIYFRYVGTDLDQFRKHFDRFEMVKGEPVPEGHRGFLIADKFYEDQVKNKVARDFDKIHRAVAEEGKKIAEDELLRTWVAQNSRQYRRITFQLEPEERARLEAELTKLLPNVKGEGGAAPSLDDLVQAFLTVDDSTVEPRYKAFYELIAPMIELYQLRVGDVITVRAYTQSGYLKSVNVKFYGTFNFRGLERSDLAAAANLMDLMTFRDLYGLMSESRRKELSALRETMGAKDVGRTDAESQLFGSGDSLVGQADDTKGFDEFSGVDLVNETERQGAMIEQTFDQASIDRGVALNAAVILSDPSELHETAKRIEDAAKGAGISVKVVDWQTASGIVGQFIIVLRMVLYIAIGIIFLVALVIINNSMVMATMERTTEIGTMRAIGAQRTSVMVMFLFETMVLGMIAGGLGAAAGVTVVAWLGKVGIPAGTQDVLIFLFGGPRLLPFFGLDNVLFGLISILIVSLVSTLYPARLATRIQPVVAMQGKE